MKIFRTIFAATLMTAAAALAVNAQPAATRPAATTPAAPAASAQLGEAKIALIDTGAFADEKQGIARMVAAVKRVETQFQTVRTELQGMRANLERLTKEIQDTKGVADQAALARKAEQAETLEKEIKRKGEDAQANYQKAMRDALQPGRDPDPVGEPAMAAHRGDRLAGLEDQERCVHAGEIPAIPAACGRCAAGRHLY